MSGIIFLLDVIAFVIVVAWAYANSGPEATGEKGLLGLKSVDPEPKADTDRPAPHWRREVGRRGAQPAPTQDARPTPGWRRKLGQRPPGA